MAKQIPAMQKNLNICDFSVLFQKSERITVVT